MESNILKEMKLLNYFELLGLDLSIKLNYIFYTQHNKRIPENLGDLKNGSYYVSAADSYMDGGYDYIVTIDNSDINVVVNTDKTISRKMQYNAIHPKKYFCIDGEFIKVVDIPEILEWDKEINARFEIWRKENSNKPETKKEIIVNSVSTFVYFVIFIIVTVGFIYILTLFPASDCVQDDRFGVNQICGDDIYNK